MTLIDRDAAFWNKIAQKYAAGRIADMAGYERSVDRTRGLLTSADVVLEIGCGTGTTALAIAPGIRRIVATDLSEAMIAIAREKAQAVPGIDAHFAVGTAETSPEVDGGYDAVLAFNLLHLVHDRAATLRAIRDRLKAGGLLITKTPALAELNLLIRLAIPLMRAIGKAPFVSTFSAGDLEVELALAGFDILAAERHGSKRWDPRTFIIARKAEDGTEQPGHRPAQYP